MAFSIQYKELFRIDILHRFFLDKGTVKFDSMSETEQTRQLKEYDFRFMLDVSPTHETVAKLNGHSLLLNRDSTGLAVWYKEAVEEQNRPSIALDDNLALTFLIQIKDPLFYNYSELLIENVGKLFYLSNRKPETEISSFPLMDKADMNHPVDEKFILSPDGMKKEKVQSGLKGGVNYLGIIRIFMKGDKSSLHITDTQGKVAYPAKEFTLTFKNRSTLWRYIFNSPQQVKPADDLLLENGNPRILVTKKIQPLTRFGFISLKLNKKELPNPGVSMIQPDQSTHKIFSEIYM
ncbi:MAG: hypothetical protein PHE44_09385 [Proteiniphilum sp.]|nr:hypothetical protein [Proteiniphilum sp.]MDD3076749.1 hypothetical protein [Proteiniphilum sp.]MDD3780407.1 hypothetical protein [Proteiniphilum sp.]MDD3955980.1 hypothetical protein [Proteiniphilum sp.]NCB26090.1 hypothetical protein [Bacteroidia bacterium]